jgi:predicted amidohydrolase
MKSKFFTQLSLFLCLVVSFAAILSAQTIGIDEFQFYSQRSEIAPLYANENDLTFNGVPTLYLAGGGNDYVNGSWRCTIPVQADTYYRFQTHFLSDQVTDVNRTVLAAIYWLNNGNQTGRTEYPPTLLEKTPEGWNIIKREYRVPSDANSAMIDLIYRWDAGGEVYFSATSVEQIPDPPPRDVSLATTHLTGGFPGPTLEDNLAALLTRVEEAAQQGAHIMCLPEGMTIAGVTDYIQGAETIDNSPTINTLSGWAETYNMYIVGHIYEREGAAVYNTAVLIDNNGEFVGKYRKVCLPREEFEGGLTPGTDFPVFDITLNGHQVCIGIMICWDVTFPEPARALAMQGAEIIFMPIWGIDQQSQLTTRATENHVYIVPAFMDNSMPSGIYDQTGVALDVTDDGKDVAMAAVDLNINKYNDWLGDWRNRILREMPPIGSVYPENSTSLVLRQQFQHGKLYQHLMLNETPGINTKSFLFISGFSEQDKNADIFDLRGRRVGTIRVK